MGYKGIGSKLKIDNADLVKEIVLSKQKGELTPRAVNYFIKIANHAVRKLTYSDPRDRDDCIQSAILDLLKYWKNFDPTKSNNAFAYFTQFAKNGYAKQFKTIHRNSSIKRTIVFKTEQPISTEKKKTLSYFKKCLEDERLDNKGLIITCFRHSVDGKRWSKWIIFDIEDYDLAELGTYTKNPTAVVQLKCEYSESVDTLSLNYGGDSEIYTI